MAEICRFAAAASWLLDLIPAGQTAHRNSDTEAQSVLSVAWQLAAPEYSPAAAAGGCADAAPGDGRGASPPGVTTRSHLHNSAVEEENELAISKKMIFLNGFERIEMDLGMEKLRFKTVENFN